MTNTEAAAKFNEAIAQMTDPDQIAKAEVAREYFTNPAFKKAVEEYSWNIAQANNVPAHDHDGWFAAHRPAR